MSNGNKEIRFINSRYETLFHIPDGGTIEVALPQESFIMHCSYIDAYHARIGDESITSVSLQNC